MEPIKSMYVIEILLPVRDNEGGSLAAKTYEALRDELTELYGGLTSFTRAPVQGETKCGDEKARDDIVVLEVMTISTARGDRAIEKSLRGFSYRMKSWFARPTSKGSDGPSFPDFREPTTRPDDPDGPTKTQWIRPLPH